MAFGSNSTCFGSKVRQERLDLVVAERPEDLRGDGDGARRAFRVVRRIELEKPRLALRVPCREARMHASGLLARENPPRRIGRRADVGAARHLLGRDRGRSNPVGEPVRIRHLVDGVDVLRTHARRLVIRRDEQVVGHLVDRLDVMVDNSGRILRIRLTRDRIVAEEALTLCRCGAAPGPHTPRQPEASAGPGAVNVRKSDRDMSNPRTRQTLKTRGEPFRALGKIDRGAASRTECESDAEPKSCFSPSRSRSAVRPVTLPAS